MSAIESIIDLVESHFDITDQDSWGIDCDAARAELSALRAAAANRSNTIDWLKRTYDYDERVTVRDVIEHLEGEQS